MSNGHGNSRRQAYGKRMKDLRTRRDAQLEVDLEGPEGWSRGGAWEDERPVAPAVIDVERGTSGVRSR